jgi:succinate dehydrogenase / fumarate reductase flavoprotein subunit
MQGLADGYFIAPYCIGNYLASNKIEKVDTSHAEFKASEAEVTAETKRMLSTKGKRTTTSFHRALGKIMWEQCGMARNATGLTKAIADIQALREEYKTNVNIPGSDGEINQALEQGTRVADFIELGELMCRDALHRNESCGGHFREEYQSAEGEAQRDDENFRYVAAWKWEGEKKTQTLVKEPLEFEYVHPSQRSYK